MATEGVVEVEEQDSEAIEKEAFEAEYNKVDGAPALPAEAPEEKGETPTDTAYLDKIKALEVQVQELSGLKNEFAKRFDSLGGKFGGVQQKLDQLASKAPAPQTASPWTSKQKEWLSKEFPEMYEGLFGGDNDVTTSETPAEPPAPKVDVESLIAERVAAESARIAQEQQSKMEEMSRKMELKAISQAHGDIGKVIDGRYILNDHQSFNEWIGRQDKETQDKIGNSWDADYLTEKLSEFKAYTKGKAKQVSKQEMAAVTRGTQRPSVSSSAEDEELAAFNKEYYGR